MGMNSHRISNRVFTSLEGTAAVLWLYLSYPQGRDVPLMGGLGVWVGDGYFVTNHSTRIITATTALVMIVLFGAHGLRVLHLRYIAVFYRRA
ncbi:hypothetical protein AVEN_137932-1 [Araneus ventricosus]|uniref:Uncharacterized protein n=1 Tax=Araneus ventricosus TaxID=182803 RepID=A0A4Y2NC73_ARAVE|nr:hypothetical protein AVEN_137932-1 [Araneus ventricosus]